MEAKEITRKNLPKTVPFMLRFGTIMKKSATKNNLLPKFLTQTACGSDNQWDDSDVGGKFHSEPFD